MLDSVSFNGVDIFEEYGAVLAHKDISAPKAQTHFVSVPLRNGDLDLTESLTGDVRYQNRPVKMKFLCMTGDYGGLYSRLANDYHGKRAQIVFSDDIGYYYIGRIDVKGYSNKNYGGYIEVEANCEPFKLSVNDAAEDWVWDTFDFEQGYINELHDIVVSGTTQIVLIADKKSMTPSITTTAQVTVTFGGKSVICAAGTTKLYDFALQEGENTISISGNATVSISYRGGRL